MPAWVVVEALAAAVNDELSRSVVYMNPTTKDFPRLGEVGADRTHDPLGILGSAIEQGIQITRLKFRIVIQQQEIIIRIGVARDPSQSEAYRPGPEQLAMALEHQGIGKGLLYGLGGIVGGAAVR